MSESKIYKITNRPQLIDLNADLVNFELDFLVKTSDPDKEFNAIVMTQEQLDIMDLNKIEMKKAKGQIGGNINANNNKYQNYFLILKKSNESEEDHDVNVIINLKKIDVPSTNPESQQEILNTLENSSNYSMNNDQPLSIPKIPFYKKPLFIFFIIIIVLLIVAFIYFKFFSKKKSNSVLIETNQNSVETYQQIQNIA